MSRFAVRNAPETALNGISPSLATAWENSPTRPFQARPISASICSPPSRITRKWAARPSAASCKVSLAYPLDTGPGAQWRGPNLSVPTFIVVLLFGVGHHHADRTHARNRPGDDRG